MKNHAASAWNRESTAVTVFYKSNWSGAIDAIVAGGKKNLTKTKNQNAAHQVGDASINASIVIRALRHPGGRITSTSTVTPTPTVDTRASTSPTASARGFTPLWPVGHQGDRGRDRQRVGLSQIAIYNAGSNKTVIYLHSNPRYSLHVGARVTRGG